MEQRKKIHLKNKLLAIGLLLAFCLSLSSCGGNMTDESVKAELERLLPLSYEMNEIFWGKGLDAVENNSSDKYKPVKDDCGYKSISEILSKASQVFSSEYMKSIESAIFTGNEETNVNPRYKEINGVLKVDTSNKGYDIKSNIVIESAKIKKQNRSIVVVTVDYEDGDTGEIELILQNGKWYLNSPSY